jgi:hypothetical protein
LIDYLIFDIYGAILQDKVIPVLRICGGKDGKASLPCVLVIAPKCCAAPFHDLSPRRILLLPAIAVIVTGEEPDQLMRSGAGALTDPDSLEKGVLAAKQWSILGSPQASAGKCRRDDPQAAGAANRQWSVIVGF